MVLATPYLIFAARPPLPAAVAAVVIARSATALGLVSSGMLAMQGAGAAVAGAVAQLSSPGAAIAAMAAVSLAVTLILAPGLRPAVRGAAG